MVSICVYVCGVKLPISVALFRTVNDSHLALSRELMGVDLKNSAAIDRAPGARSKSDEFFKSTPISSRDMKGVNHSQFSIFGSLFGNFTLKRGHPES